MAENETNETNEAQETTDRGGSGARTAVKAAAAAAATGAAALAARKKFASSSNGKSNGSSEATKGRGSSTLLTSIASGGWDAARDALLPLAEDAAGAAGTYLAKNGPDIVRDKIVPRFISSFNEAKGD
jgi:hypothetical protein